MTTKPSPRETRPEPIEPSAISQLEFGELRADVRHIIAAVQGLDELRADVRHLVDEMKKQSERISGVEKGLGDRLSGVEKGLGDRLSSVENTLHEVKAQVGLIGSKFTLLLIGLSAIAAGIASLFWTVYGDAIITAMRNTPILQ